MPCAIDVIDTRLQSTSHIRCNRSSFNQNIGNHFSKGQQIRKPVSVRPENRDTALTILKRGLGSDLKPDPFLSDVQEVKVKEVISLTSGAPGTEGPELSSAKSRVLYSSVQPNERNMHAQVDSSKSVSNENPHRGNKLKQARKNKKNVCNSSTAIPPCPVVAKKSSNPVTATLKSDSDILHDDEKPPKRCPERKGGKKSKQYKRKNCKRLNLASEITSSEGKSCSVSPVESLPISLLPYKLSETTSSVSSLVKEGYVDYGTMMNLSTLGTDEMDGSDCTGSSNDAMGERLSCSSVPYLSSGPNTTESTDSSFFSRCNSDTNRNYSVDVDASLTIKAQNRRNHLQLGPSTGLNDVRVQCHSISSYPSATHAEDIHDPFGSSSSCSKDVTDSASHTERVQCSSEACSSVTSPKFSSGRNNRKSRKTPSYSDLTVSNKVPSANSCKKVGKDSPAVWQKVEKMDKTISRAGHVNDSPIQDKSAHEETNKGVQKDPTRHRAAKQSQRRKACKQEPPSDTVETESNKEEEDALNSCRTFPKSIYKKQVPFLQQQRSSSSQQGSQSMKNYYAPKNGISKGPKDYSHEEGSLMSQLVHVRDTSNSCSGDEVILSGVGRYCPTKGNEIPHSGIDKAALASCNLVPVFAPQAASNKVHISTAQEDPHYLCPENKGASAIWSSRNLRPDPYTAELEGARSVKSTTENNPQEYSAAGHVSQKWIPVGKKEMSNVIRSDASETSAVEASVHAADISDSADLAYNNGKDRKLVSELTSRPNSSEHIDSKLQTCNGTVTGYNKITKAISDVLTVYQRVKDVQLCIGRPLADVEQFILSASPVVCCSPCPTRCKSYLQECVKDGLSLHPTPDISLSSVWQWYEEHGCYGLEVKAQNFRRSKGLSNSQSQFTSYFVPYLSAVQLFSQPKRSSSGTIDKEAVDMVACETSPCLNLPPIFAKLLPKEKPRNKLDTLRTEDDQQLTSGELIFEFFESEQPYWRRQLFDKVNELISGVKPSNCQISGDPKNLERSLHDLHPASWYCVAWYPVYLIPDGKFQAAFLTYHSLGHWNHRSSSSTDQTGQAPVALPVIGLQSYNDKAEQWFQISKPDAEDAKSAESSQASSEASQVLKERLRTLNQAASVMSRADVLKNGVASRNRHSDFEFFLSRS